MRRGKRRKTSREQEEGPFDIPEEILVEILTRLPVKSLLRCRCVSKSWKSLITSPNFISAHLTRISSPQFTDINEDSLLLLGHQPCNFPYFSEELFSLRRDVGNLPEYRRIDPPPYKKSKDGYYMIGCCGGLVCLLDKGFCDVPTRLILWNPLLRKCFVLPDPPASHNLDIKRDHIFGFGFDPESNDFKVVVVVGRKEGNRGVLANVGIYSFNSRSWNSRCIDFGSSLQQIGRRDHVILNGVVHLLASRTVDGIRQAFVLTYSPRNDSFDEVMLPENVATNFNLKFLCLYDSHLTVILLAYKHWEVWVMEEYGVLGTWIKKFDFVIKRGLKGPVGFTRNGEMLVKRWRTKLDSLNPQTYRIKNLKIQGRCSDFFALPYVESLVLLDEPFQYMCPEAQSTELDARKREKSQLLATSHSLKDMLKELMAIKQNSSGIDPPAPSSPSTSSCWSMLSTPCSSHTELKSQLQSLEARLNAQKQLIDEMLCKWP